LELKIIIYLKTVNIYFIFKSIIDPTRN